MASILGGFVKGFTGRQLDLIDQRRKQEAEMKKMEMLEQLRRETAQWEWTNDPSKKLSVRATEQRMRLDESQEARAIEQEKRASAEHGLKMREGEQKLGLDAQAAARAERVAQAQIAASGRQGGRGLEDTKPLTEQDVMREVKYQNKDLLASLTSGPRAPLTFGRADQVLSRIVANTRTPAEAERNFREYLYTIEQQTRRK